MNLTVRSDPWWSKLSPPPSGAAVIAKLDMAWSLERGLRALCYRHRRELMCVPNAFVSRSDDALSLLRLGRRRT
jgi:hypothetical protein